MLCPNCQTPMREREKDDVIMDICPNCRGVWLDAGELEKLTVSEHSYYRQYRWEDDEDYERDRRFGERPRRRRGFLGGLFEGDD